MSYNWLLISHYPTIGDIISNEYLKVMFKIPKYCRFEMDQVTRLVSHIPWTPMRFHWNFHWMGSFPGTYNSNNRWTFSIDVFTYNCIKTCNPPNPMVDHRFLQARPGRIATKPCSARLRRRAEAKANAFAMTFAMDRRVRRKEGWSCVCVGGHFRNPGRSSIWVPFFRSSDSKFELWINR